MNAEHPIEIVGGGLAGLSLGLALQRRGARTTIFEAGRYPRHRVCGEFIAGLREATILKLGLQKFFADAKSHRSVRWFYRGRVLRDQRLARPALALSRHSLDARLAEAYVAAGGNLVTEHRIDLLDTPVGRVFTAGRRRRVTPWLGLKCHVRGLRLESDLEFHLGREAYVGLAAVEGDRVNVCGLFRRRTHLDVDRGSAMFEYLRAVGLGGLAQRLKAHETDPASISAVAGFGFGVNENADPARIELGDAFGMIPPYTGHGMAMAFESAESALPHLERYAAGELDWPETVSVVKKALHARFYRKLTLAARLHPFLLSRAPQRLFQLANRTRLLPLRALAGALHT